MNLLEAQETKMPWGVHTGKPLREISAKDRTYLTEFLAGKLDSLDAWLREAVEIVIAEGAPAEASDERQGDLFGNQMGEQLTGEKS